MSDTVSEKVRIGAPSIEGFTEEGEHLVASKVDTKHSHGMPGKNQVMTSRAERMTSFDLADFAEPTGREEEWRFTPIAKLAPLFHESTSAALLIESTLPDGVERDVLDAASARELTSAPPADRAAAAALANAEGAVRFVVPAEAELDQPVKVMVRGNGTEKTFGHLIFQVGANAKATIILEHEGSAQFSELVSIDAGEGAKVSFISIQRWEDDTVHAAQHDVLVSKDATVKHIAVSLGGELVRVNTNASYGGEGAEAQLYGLYFADAGQHLEHRTFIDHNEPRCVSNVLYKGALQGRDAHTVWVGDVLIQKQAEGTDSYEKNQNLVLTKGARADSVPNLEIETGLIEGAGHASSTGRFDDEHLFYLMARGIPEDVARRLVVRGFLNEIIQKIGVPEIEEQLTEDMERELSAGNV